MQKCDNKAFTFCYCTRLWPAVSCASFLWIDYFKYSPYWPNCVILRPLWTFCFSPAFDRNSRSSVAPSIAWKERQMTVFALGSACDFPAAFKLWLNASLAFQSWQWWLNVDDGWSPAQGPLRDGTFYVDYMTWEEPAEPVLSKKTYV